MPNVQRLSKLVLVIIRIIFGSVVKVRLKSLQNVVSEPPAFTVWLKSMTLQQRTPAMPAFNHPIPQVVLTIKHNR